MLFFRYSFFNWGHKCLCKSMALEGYPSKCIFLALEVHQSCWLFFFPPSFQSLRELLLILESLFTPRSHPLSCCLCSAFLPPLSTIAQLSNLLQLTPELMSQYLILKAGQLIVTFLLLYNSLTECLIYHIYLISGVRSFVSYGSISSFKNPASAFAIKWHYFHMTIEKWLFKRKSSFRNQFGSEFSILLNTVKLLLDVE